MKTTLTHKAKYHKQKADVSLYDRLEDDGFYYQLIEGVLEVAPSPLTFHQKVSIELSHIMMTFLESHPMGELFVAPLDVEFNNKNIYQPDILFISNERQSIIQEKRIVGPPDLVIEILSDGTKSLDLGPKYKVYEQSGVLEFWVVDPKTKSFSFFQSRDKHFHEIPFKESYRSQVLKPFILNPVDFWGKI